MNSTHNISVHIATHVYCFITSILLLFIHGTSTEREQCVMGYV